MCIKLIAEWHESLDNVAREQQRIPVRKTLQASETAYQPKGPGTISVQTYNPKQGQRHALKAQIDTIYLHGPFGQQSHRREL